jgi:ubiquitin-protein ligase
MSRSESEQKRLLYEKQLTYQKFPQFKVVCSTTELFWSGEVRTNNRNKYKIRVEIPQRFPDVQPEVYIEQPCPLYTFDRQKLVDRGACHDMHVLGPKNGWVHMCLFDPETWSPALTINDCLAKACLWLNVFDDHLRTGKTLSILFGC